MKAPLLLLLCFLIVKFAANSKNVTDDECVYARFDEILGEKFNATTQICCPMSGIHARYQDKTEMDCCGEGLFKPKVEYCCSGQVYVKKMQTKCNGCMCRKKNLKKAVKRGKSSAGGGNSSQAHQSSVKEIKILKKRCNKKSRRNSCMCRIWKIWTRRSKNTKHLFIIID